MQKYFLPKIIASNYNYYSATGNNKCSKMSLLMYFKSCNKANLRGSLSAVVPLRAISHAQHPRGAANIN